MCISVSVCSWDLGTGALQAANLSAVRKAACLRCLWTGGSCLKKQDGIMQSASQSHHHEMLAHHWPVLCELVSWRLRTGQHWEQ